MPIRPENKDRYPKNWNSVIRPMILKRANNRCEICGVENHSAYIRKRDGKLCHHILTIAHISEEIEDVRPENLLALCCFCHNGMDAEMRARHRKENKAKEDKSLTINFE